MQRLIYLTSLLIVSSFHVRAEKNLVIEGLYYNPKYDMEILVEYSRNKLKVKGLDNRRNWQKFRRVDRNSWRDKKGNHLVLGRRGQLIFHSRRSIYGRRSNILHFYRSKARRTYKNNPRYYNDRRGSRNEFSGDDYDSDIYGSWYSQDFKLNMYVEPFRDGLRTRLENEEDWTKYKKSNQGNYWEDNKGNQLRKDGSGELFWQSKNGRRKIKLSKKYNKN